MKKLALSLLLASGMLAGTAQAASMNAPGPYIGAGVGLSSFNADGARSVFDHNGMGGDIFGGYRFNKTFAAEVGYARLANSQLRNGDFSGKVRNEMFSVSGLAYAPLNDTLSVFGRAGLAHTAVRGAPQHLHETNAVLGLGTEYDINRQLALRAEVQYLPHFGDSKLSATYVTTGLKYKF